MRALIFRGGWDGHDPIETVDLLVSRLEPSGMACEVIESLDPLRDLHHLRGYDVLVPAWTMGMLPTGAAGAIADAVEAGVGLAGWHGGMGDAFRGEPTFQFVTGGQFVAHPGGIIDYEVRLAEPDHPITAGLPDRFMVRSEQYYMHVDPTNRVLAETMMVGPDAEWIRGVAMPVVWTRRHGAGRVAYSALGHNIEDFAAEPCLTLAERCVLWAAGALGQ
ncbi:MAG: ThuA domain-containing protein [Phycisphaeraceae bacterium]|nr:MAG: ThuA domain-containing protein [Phycisphaeraceae bacterium]